MKISRFLVLLVAILALAACESTTEGTGGASGAGQGGSMQTATAPTKVGVQADRVFFDFDESTLKPQARSTIETWATWMKNNPSATVTIEGHCDERGTREYNLALGERRASAVKNYLVALGISPNRIRTISYGKERPAVPGHNEAAWAKNRRAVFTQG